MTDKAKCFIFVLSFTQKVNDMKNLKQIANVQIELAKIQEENPSAVLPASEMLSALGIEHSLSTSDYLPELSDNPKVLAAIIEEFGEDGDSCGTLLSAVRLHPSAFWRTVKNAL